MRKTLRVYSTVRPLEDAGPAHAKPKATAAHAAARRTFRKLTPVLAFPGRNLGYFRLDVTLEATAKPDVL
jgi:hypothetical protein